MQVVAVSLVQYLLVVAFVVILYFQGYTTLDSGNIGTNERSVLRLLCTIIILY